MTTTEPQRRALKNLGGPVFRSGDDEKSTKLAAAWQRAATEDADVLTHGFHAYPARMHWALAAQLLEDFSNVDDVVLDPFCGSGTVLVEAQRLHRRGAGIDLSPVALRVSEVKTHAADEAARERLSEALVGVVLRSKERVRLRDQSRAPVTIEEAAQFQNHVLRELGVVWEEIQAVDNDDDRRTLEVVLSSLIVKLSKRRADTSQEHVAKRMGRFIPTEMFERKAQELLVRFAAYDDAVPKDAKAPRLLLGDARQADELLDVDVDLVLSSPPYGGTYDYARHHEIRLGWLGLPREGYMEDEMGARRRSDDGVGAFDDDMGTVLSALARGLSKQGKVVLVQGDAEVRGVRVAADEQLRRLARDVGLVVTAVASQERPEWQRPARGPRDLAAHATNTAPRREHLVLLERTPVSRR